jgi:hypothetical protein
MTIKLGWLSLLGFLFVTLKLTGTIAWSWWWVLAPFWGPFVALGIFAVCVTVVVLALDWMTR